MCRWQDLPLAIENTSSGDVVKARAIARWFNELGELGTDLYANWGRTSTGFTYLADRFQSSILDPEED